MGATVPKKGVQPSDVFLCDDCGDPIRGQRIIDGEYVYYVKQDRSNPNNNTYRCADCQDERWANF
jgi:uncharacterized protein YlaI